ncbi:hypothetical protein ACWKWU_13085 [Chitinophaga lutea]
MRYDQNKLKAFFKDYETRFNAMLHDENVEVQDFADAFADYFVGSNPKGVMGAPNDEKFLEQLPKANAFYKTIGTTSMRIDKLEITQLDDFHAMVKAYWNSVYRQVVHIDFSVIYLVTMAGSEPKIFAYITGDEQAALREKGLLPNE